MPCHLIRTGGVAGGRLRDPDDSFEVAADRAMGDRLRLEQRRPRSRADGRFGERLYGSITNQDWRHENGDSVGYTFRAAGDLVAALVGEGDYLDWYCSAPEGVVDPEVAELLAREGWRPIGEPAAARDTRKVP